MSKLKLLTAALLGCLAVSALANEGDRAFVGATIIDGTGAAPLSNGVVVISDGRIRAIGAQDDVEIPAGADVIDVSGRTIIPGLINAHGHVGGTLGLEGGHYTRDNLQRQLSLYARYGITTVVSLGGDGAEGLALRNEQNNSDLTRSRLFVAGDVITGNSEQQIRDRVNAVADSGVDYIKVRVDDNLGNSQKMSQALFSALVDQAHSRRLPVAVHLFYQDDARFVLDQGADLIAHSIRDEDVDSDFVNQLAQSGVCYIPTLTREVSTFVYESEPDFFGDPFFLQEVDDDILATLREPARQQRVRNSASAQAYKAALQVAMRNVAALHEAGIPIAMGTDSGPPARFQGYFEHLELSMMVESGMSPAAVIQSATGVAAQCAGLTDLGTLEPGNWGDLVILEENPLAAIENTHSIESVWIAGNRVPTP
ncbi:MAG: amidohydrolase family protein [Gammaproteobacteria bacterium]